MKIAVVSGSSRANSQSRKIADWIVGKLSSFGHEGVLIDLHTTVLPLDVDLGVDDIRDEPRAYDAWLPIAGTLADIDGVAVVTPEWNGMAPPALLNFFNYTATDGLDRPLAHRPLQFFSVAVGVGGSYPLSQMRSYGQKNNLTVVIPCHVAIRNCKHVFNGFEPEAGNEADKYLQERVSHSLEVLLEYASAMKTLRESARVDLTAYPYGH